MPFFYFLKHLTQTKQYDTISMFYTFKRKGVKKMTNELTNIDYNETKQSLINHTLDFNEEIILELIRYNLEYLYIDNISKATETQLLRIKNLINELDLILSKRF